MRYGQTIAPAGASPVLAGSLASLVTHYRTLVVSVVSVLATLMLAGCAGEPPKQTRVGRVDQVVVKKSERKMQLIHNGEVVREYRIALGAQPRGHKMEQGDERTPEGDYVLDWRNPSSLYYKSIHVSYPNERDIRFARFMESDPGGMIMIHGQPDYLRSARIKAEYQRRDWTDGCIAVQNDEMDEIWRAVRDGTPIRILP